VPASASRAHGGEKGCRADLDRWEVGSPTARRPCSDSDCYLFILCADASGSEVPENSTVHAVPLCLLKHLECSVLLSVGEL
jgi:hypothetical protein